jgi:hypothetical protein
LVLIKDLLLLSFGEGMNFMMPGSSQMELENFIGGSEQTKA